jgi:hypothetical protein
VLRIFFTFHLILISWVFFRAENIDQALMVLKRIGSALPSIPGLIGNYPFTAEHYLGFTLVLSLLVIEILDERRAIWERLKAMPVALRWGTYYAGIFALLMVGRWQAGEFIYMQF